MAGKDDAGLAETPEPAPGPLDGLAQRLGALEESLTVVATEVGISAMPRFKRVDPESVYKEAVRRAQDVAEPMRLALRRLEARLDEAVSTLEHLQREQTANGPDPAHAARLDGMERHIAGLLSRLDEAAQPHEPTRRALEEGADRLATLSLRMDTVWQQLDEDKARRDAEREGELSPRAILHRLAGLEQRAEKLANAIAAATAQPAAADRPTSAATIQDEIARQLKAALAARAESERPAIAADAIESEVARQLAALPRQAASADRAAIEHEVARQFAALLAASGGVGSDARSDAAAMLQAIPDEGSGEMAPLVMGATERAIVRLTTAASGTGCVRGWASAPTA